MGGGTNQKKVCGTGVGDEPELPSQKALREWYAELGLLFSCTHTFSLFQAGNWSTKGPPGNWSTKGPPGAKLSHTSDVTKLSHSTDVTKLPAADSIAESVTTYYGKMPLLHSLRVVRVRH